MLSTVCASTRTWGLQNNLGCILAFCVAYADQWLDYVFGMTLVYLMDFQYSALRERCLSGAGGFGEKALPTPGVTCAHQPALATTTTPSPCVIRFGATASGVDAF